MPMPPDDATSHNDTVALREILVELTQLRRQELVLLETLSRTIGTHTATTAAPLPLSETDHFDFTTTPECPAPPDLASTAYTALQPLAGLDAEPNADIDGEARADAQWLEAQIDFAASADTETKKERRKQRS